MGCIFSSVEVNMALTPEVGLRIIFVIAKDSIVVPKPKWSYEASRVRVHDIKIMTAGDNVICRILKMAGNNRKR